MKLCHSICDTPVSKMSPHTKFGIPTLNNMRYAQHTMFLELRLEVKVTVTWKMYVILHNPEMYPHTKFWIPRRHALKAAFS